MLSKTQGDDPSPSNNFQFGAPRQKFGKIQLFNAKGEAQTLTRQELEQLGFSAMQLHTIQLSQAQANERLQRMAAEGQLFDASMVADQLMQADLAHRSLSRMLMASSQNEVAAKI